MTLSHWVNLIVRQYEIAREMSEIGVAGIGYALFKLFLAITLLGQALLGRAVSNPWPAYASVSHHPLLFAFSEQPTGRDSW